MPRASTAKTGLLQKSQNAQAEELARQGRGADTEVAHLTNGEMVLPLNFMRKHEKQVAELVKLMGEMGIDPRTRIVGTPEGPKNPRTGLEEFDEGGGGANDGSANGGGSDTGTGGQGGGGGGGGTGTGGSDPDGTSAKSGFDGMNADRNSDPANDKGPDAPGARDSAGGNSYTGISFIDRQIQNVIDNPVKSLINTVVGLVPGVGLVNTISGVLGGPTIGGAATAAGRGLSSGETQAAEAPTDPRGGDEGGGDGMIDDARDAPGAENGRMPVPDAYVPSGLLQPSTNRLSNQSRPRPTQRFTRMRA